MKYCPDCGEEFEDILTRCPICEVDLVFSVDEERDQISDFDSDGEDVPAFADLVVVYKGDSYSADLIQGDLVANDIDAWIAAEEVVFADISAWPIPEKAPAVIEVAVSLDNEQRALDLIEGTGGLTDTQRIDKEAISGLADEESPDSGE